MSKLLELKQKLEAIDGGSEIYESFTNILNEEKTAISKEKNKEAQSLRERLHGLKQTLANADIVIDDNTELEAVATKLREMGEKVKDTDKNKSDKKTLETQMEAMKRQLSDLSGKYENTVTELSNERKASKTATIKQSLHAAIGEKLHGPKFVIDGLVNDGLVDLDEDKKIVWRDGENNISFDDGIKNFLEKHPEVVKNSQRSGSGGSSGNNEPADNNSDEAVRNKLRALHRA